MSKNKAHFLFTFSPNWSRYRTVHGSLSISSAVFCTTGMLFPPRRCRSLHAILKLKWLFFSLKVVEMGHGWKPLSFLFHVIFFSLNDKFSPVARPEDTKSNLKVFHQEILIAWSTTLVWAQAPLHAVVAFRNYNWECLPFVLCSVRLWNREHFSYCAPRWFPGLWVFALFLFLKVSRPAWRDPLHLGCTTRTGSAALGVASH